MSDASGSSWPADAALEQSVSVVIPTRDRSEPLLRALRSVTHQTRAVDEIIVVDDGSRDDTVAQVRARFPEVIVVRQRHRGVSAARNRGIRETSGAWIALLDSDDEWQATKIERQMQALAAQPDRRLCHTDEIWIRHGRRVNPMRKHRKSGGWIYANCLPMCVISPSAVLMRRDLFAEIGVFDEQLPVCEDYDMWLRVCSREPVLYLDEQLVIKHGGHADQLSRRYWGMDRFRIAALEKILERGHLNVQDEAATLETLREKIQLFAMGARKRGKMDEAAHYEGKLQRWDAERLRSGSCPEAGGLET